MNMFGLDIIQAIFLILVISLEYLAVLIGLYWFLYHKPRRLNTLSNPTLVKPKLIDYSSKLDFIKDMQQYKLDRKINRVPEYLGQITVIILRENKWSKILYFSGDVTDFTFGKCLYFITTPHTCDNGAKLIVYLEGISLPISYENVQKEQVKKQYVDIDGIKKETIITVIKGLKWDGKILHIFTNRKFAEIFTKIEPDILPLITFIIGTCTLIVSCIGIGVTYFLR